MNHLSPKIRALQMAPKSEVATFLKMAIMILIKFE
jgi:hypothetical protein